MSRPSGSRRLTHHEKVERNRKVALRDRRARWLRLWGGVAAAAVAAAAFAYQLLLGASKQGIVDLDAAGPDNLRAVFTEGHPWIVLCVETLPTADYPSEFDHAARVLDRTVRFGVLNCSAPLPSGKDVYSRFGLGRQRPAYLFMANTAKPQLVPDSARAGDTLFVEWIERKSKPRLAVVRANADLRSATAHRLSVLVLVKGAMDSARRASLVDLAARHRRIRFAVANHTRLATSLDRFLPETDENGVAVVAFRTEGGGGVQAGAAERTLLARAFRGDAAAALGSGGVPSHRVLTIDGEERWLSLDEFLSAADREPALLDFRALRRLPRLRARSRGGIRSSGGESSASGTTAHSKERSSEARSAGRPDRRATDDARGTAREERAARRQRAQQQQHRQRQEEAEKRRQEPGQAPAAEEATGHARAAEEERQRREALDRVARASPHIAWAADDGDDGGAEAEGGREAGVDEWDDDDDDDDDDDVEATGDEVREGVEEEAEEEGDEEEDEDEEVIEL